MKSLVGITLALGAVGAGAYLMLGGQLPHTPALSGSTRRRRTSLRGTPEISELKLWIDNDGQLYRQQKKPIIDNLTKKLTKGVYDKTKAEKLWMYLVENGAKSYTKRFGGTWHKMFSMTDRKAVAKALNEDFLSEHAHG